jgi:hypothetical protein
MRIGYNCNEHFKLWFDKIGFNWMMCHKCEITWVFNIVHILCACKVLHLFANLFCNNVKSMKSWKTIQWPYEAPCLNSRILLFIHTLLMSFNFPMQAHSPGLLFSWMSHKLILAGVFSWLFSGYMFWAGMLLLCTSLSCHFKRHMSVGTNIPDA